MRFLSFTQVRLFHRLLHIFGQRRENWRLAIASEDVREAEMDEDTRWLSLVNATFWTSEKIC